MLLHTAFSQLRTTKIQSLKIEVQHYKHKKTGADHYHLASENPENVFLVAFRTVPMDSTGVAHILEHTVLCGSEKYPVRDPFFMMIRRSLNTFMNAFTSSDWTAYPFASQNRKDFFNLLDVYLDAVFFSRLHELDFAQEGHRLEFTDDGKTLEYKGVVYNEMKGAMSSPVSLVWQTLTRYLYPTTTYHYNSGGDPDTITDLSYEQLLEFYRSHYHPSNAVFMTYGDIPVYEIHQRIEANALIRFEKLSSQIIVGDEKRFFAPVKVLEHYPVESADELENKTHIVFAWLLGKSTNLRERLRADLLASILLENSASPLRHALETSGLGTAPSPLCGLEDSMREMSFVCGIEGSNPEHADALEQLVRTVLNNIAEQGVPQQDVEAALHQLEIDQREIGGDSYPYGLQLILNGLSSAVHYANPTEVLDLDHVLAELHEQIKTPGFVQGLVREFLLQNEHYVRLVMAPNAQITQRHDLALAEKLQRITQGLSVAQKEQIKKQTAALQERQTCQDNEDLLPKVGIADVPAELKLPEGQTLKTAPYPLHYYPQGTNGIVYQQVVMDFPQLAATQMEIMPHFSSLLTELGCGEMDYLQTQSWQTRISGGISAFVSMRATNDNSGTLSAYFSVSTKGLVRNHAEITRLLRVSLEHARFDELKRIRELINQKRSYRERSITGNGHGFAMLAAASGISTLAYLTNKQQGLSAIKSLKLLDDSLKDQSCLQEFAGQLAEIHACVVSQKRQLLLIGEPQFQEQLLADIQREWQPQQLTTTAKRIARGIDYAADLGIQKQCWSVNTQVNFCAKAYPTVNIEHADAAALTVLGGFLRNGYLHRAIREQGGAYGGGASQDSAIAAFKFYSYRDPRLSETLKDFDRAIDWLFTNKHQWRQVEEAILGVVGGIDKPGSPAGEAKDEYYNYLHGRTVIQRREFRRRVLAIQLEDLLRVAKTYLVAEKASVAVVTNKTGETELEAEQFNKFEL